MHPDIDKYAHLTSPIHRWDPRVKIVAMFLCIFTFATLQKLSLVAAGLAISLSLALLSRIPLSFMAKRLVPVTIFLAPFFIIMPLSVTGGSVVKVLNISVHLSGFLIAARIYLKALSIVMLIIVMMGTAPFTDSLKAMEKLRVSPRITQMIHFTYRYIFVFILEMRRMNTAMKARHFEKKTNMHTIKTVGNFVGVLLVRSFERAERTYLAMVSRGYDGTLRTFFDYKIVPSDYLKAAGVALISVAMFTCDKFLHCF